MLPPANYTFGEKEYKELFAEPYYPNVNIYKLIKKYNIDLIIVNKECLQYAFEKGYRYDLTQFEKLYENERFEVYRV